MTSPDMNAVTSPISDNATLTSLSCAQLIYNVTSALGLFESPQPAGLAANVSSEQLCHLAITGAIESVIAPAICLFGIAGNVLNLVVLTRKRLQCSMEHMEVSAHMGLVALALSDLCFCAVYVVALFTPSRFEVSPCRSEHSAKQVWGLLFAVVSIHGKQVCSLSLTQ